MLFFCNLSVFGISFKKNSQSFAVTKTPRKISYTRKKKKGRTKKEIEKEKKKEKRKP